MSGDHSLPRLSAPMGAATPSPVPGMILAFRILACQAHRVGCISECINRRSCACCVASEREKPNHEKTIRSIRCSPRRRPIRRHGRGAGGPNPEDRMRSRCAASDDDRRAPHGGDRRAREQGQAQDRALPFEPARRPARGVAERASRRRRWRSRSHRDPDELRAAVRRHRPALPRKDQDAAYRLFDSPVFEQELARPAASAGFHVVGVWEVTFRNVYTRAKPINSVADMKGRNCGSSQVRRISLCSVR